MSKKNYKTKKFSKDISLPDRCMLWGRAAGRCQFEGCNKKVDRSEITREVLNLGELGHINSASKHGPRGHGNYSKNIEKRNSPENLMLLCRSCHKLVDDKAHQEKYPASLLRRWKNSHEKKVEYITGITNNKKTQTVIYEARIGSSLPKIDEKEIEGVIFPDYYTMSNPINLSASHSINDGEDLFWATQKNDLFTKFNQRIEPLIERASATHFTLFCLAPMPLLIRLGTLFNDKIKVEVRQPLKEPQGWKWQTCPRGFEFIINEPESFKGKPALVISLSGKIKPQRVADVLGEEVSIWELTLSDKQIGNDNIRCKKQLSMFRESVRKLMNEIQNKHGCQPLSVFPAMAASCSIEMGRVRMNKADMPWTIYDQNNKHNKFIKTITIGD